MGTGGMGGAGGSGGIAQPICGDGNVDIGEECDDGNANDTDGCVSGCVNAKCGDGFVQSGVEECDDSNADNTDGCIDTCKSAACGDGFVQSGVEECDDSNAENTDGCIDTCKSAACGDGFVRAGMEECDDSNADNTDGCIDTCKSAACGDGFVRAGMEECDDGNTSNDDACVGACVPAACGDGYVRSGVEECDDGGTSVADGCDATCVSESLPFFEDFDGATHRMSLSSSSAQAYWHISTDRAVSPANSLRCADPTAGNYNVGTFDASAVTPYFLVPAAGASITFQTIKLTETDEDYDILYVETLDDTGAVSSLSTVNGSITSFAEKTVSIPVSAAGKYLQVRFKFDTIDQYANNYEGVYIDDISITAAACGDGVVNSDEDCDDGNTLGNDGCSANCTTDCAPNTNAAAAIVSGSSCYAAYASLVTPTAAEAACVALGGQLVTITSAAENAVVRTLLPATQFAIGLNDVSVEGTYQWYSGEMFSYSNWSSGEPNNFNGNEDCVEILTSGQWNDMDCTSTRAYICEFAYP
jgi:cysteine-rich repeat protein